MATAYLYKTLGTPTSDKKYTFSTWAKRAMESTEEVLISGGTSGSNGDFLVFRSTDQLEWQMYHGTNTGILKTNRLFRDTAAWYHIVITYDSANVTAGDRMKMYINGVEETSFATDTNPPQDTASYINSAVQNNIGYDTYGLATSAYFGGVLAHTQLCDGQAYAASDFGETDSTSGIWVPKSSPSVTYGNNGFFLKYQDTAAFGDDSSGNTNDFTMSGTITQTKDTPNNNFCTLNSVYPSNGYSNQSPTFANGNNTLTTVNASGQWGISPSTRQLTTGKWYAECTVSATSGNAMLGLLSSNWSADQFLGYFATDYGWYSSDGKVYNNNDSGATASLNTYGAANIIGIYLDLDNNKLYYAKDGVIENSGTGISITAAGSTGQFGYMLASQEWNSGGNGTFQWNFGNGYFGTTVISGAVADAEGIGQFKYNPSTGTFDGSSKDFRAICTKNISTYG